MKGPPVGQLLLACDSEQTALPHSFPQVKRTDPRPATPPFCSEHPFTNGYGRCCFRYCLLHPRVRTWASSAFLLAVAARQAGGKLTPPANVSADTALPTASATIQMASVSTLPHGQRRPAAVLAHFRYPDGFPPDPCPSPSAHGPLPAPVQLEMRCSALPASSPATSLQPWAQTSDQECTGKAFSSR